MRAVICSRRLITCRIFVRAKTKSDDPWIVVFQNIRLFHWNDRRCFGWLDHVRIMNSSWRGCAGKSTEVYRENDAQESYDGKPDKLRGGVAAVRGDTTARSRFPPPAFRFPTPHGVAVATEMHSTLLSLFALLFALLPFHIRRTMNIR